ncbi:class I SAM-dependent methyltransferase [Pseudoruegeria sp. SHC-113]|uniref:class I SAM-dependent methyltransferase n=1 Tax=Pseudoruegeria sp. SHC-113 TaxID=2855439 RepID=UPI0021BB5E78|nr:SAM-dependent methyltransferase [Pseudoruegeria sp. SHC-113]MCT8161998.1 SAM-dependent methyltransferase [Pseudoruegeria sp. SHC-113]
MSALKQILIDRIRAGGPISLADYMAECLMHPEHGYYSTRDPFGAGGDFTTAPEISQMFGELCGLSLAQAWLDQGAPSPFLLVELGPGRGTLMADLLRATKGVPGFHAAMRLHLVEASPVLRGAQRTALEGFDVQWHESLADVPLGPIFLIANEFFDALPLRQFERAAEGWSERLVGLSEDGTLSFGLSRPAPIAVLDGRLEDTRPGDLVEVSSAGRAIAGEIAERIARAGGAALIVDYGDWRSLGDTLQALRGHAPTDPLTAPGQADLTAHVDFETLAQAAAGKADISRLTPQGIFLERLGLTARAQALAKGLAGEALTAHVAAHRRLAHPDEMGRLFKVLAMVPQGALMPPGVER